MKKRLNGRETLLIATMLFGMFFGAGNLIFPVYMGQLAGRNIWKAIAGFIITGVSLPLRLLWARWALRWERACWRARSAPSTRTISKP